MKKIVLLLSVLSVSAFAQTANQQQPPKGDRPQISAEMKAAFEACKASGKPGDTAFDTCMESKGFKKPAGGPGHGQPPTNGSKSSSTN